MPVALSHGECMAILCGLERVPRLQAGLLYGCGLRTEECIKLRVKDIDLDNRTVAIHGGKGDKDRVVRLPESVVAAVEDQMRRCVKQHRSDQAAGLFCPDESESLMRKLGRATFASLPWFWLFPSRMVRHGRRWHANRGTLAKAVKASAEDAGITKRVTLHGLRHAYATVLLRSCVDIRTIQVQLGHDRVETTEIYAHAAALRTVASPLDSQCNVIEMPRRTGLSGVGDFRAFRGGGG
jgi:site-specific recombinase XerD